MSEEEKDVIENIKAVAFLLATVEKSADIPTEIINRIGDLIQDQLIKLTL